MFKLFSKNNLIIILIGIIAFLYIKVLLLQKNIAIDSLTPNIERYVPITRMLTKIDYQYFDRVIEKPILKERLIYKEKVPAIAIAGIELIDKGTIDIKVAIGKEVRTFRQEIAFKGKTIIVPDTTKIDSLINFVTDLITVKKRFGLDKTLYFGFNSNFRPVLQYSFFYINKLWFIENINTELENEFGLKGESFLNRLGISLGYTPFPNYSSLSINIGYNLKYSNLNDRTITLSLCTELWRF